MSKHQSLHKRALSVAFAALLASACSGGADTAATGEPSEALVNDGTAEPAPPAVALGYPPKAPVVEVTEDGVKPVDDSKIGTTPVVLSATPPEGHAAGGDVVSINGESFAEGAEVYFGDVKAADVFWIDTQWINATTPEGSPGLVDLRVVNPDGAEGKLAGGFLFFDDLEVHAVVPGTGSPTGGEPVTITGRGFEPGIQVLFGDRLALDVAVQSGVTLTALTPPNVVGHVDVRAVLVGEEVASLDHGFRYAGAPNPSKAWPPHGPTIGGSQVELTGQHFTADMSVTVGGKPAELISVNNDGTQATIVAPGGAAGPTDLHVANEDGEGTLYNGFTYLAPDEGGLTLWTVSPPSGPTGGGYTATLVVQGLDPDATIGVKFGDTKATVEASDLYPNTIFVEVPPGSPGPVVVSVNQGSDFDLLQNGFHYEAALGLSGGTPTDIPAAGGALLTLYGEGFESVSSGDLSVFVGALSATSIDVVSDGHIVVGTPACSPGPTPVTVSSGVDEATLTGVVVCVPAEPQLLAIDPSDVSQAGGALVRVIGVGIPDDAKMIFGNGDGSMHQWESAQSLWVRVPPGEPGFADAQLTSKSKDASWTLAEGVLYVDTANKKAAVWGKTPIERTINVTIFDGSTGKRLSEATAILGADASTKFQCVTDERGQCVISFHGVAGPQTITAAKFQFSAYTIAGFNGTNVSMFIRPQSPPPSYGPGGPGTPINIMDLTGTISGQVNGIGKYVVPPPGDCKVLGSPDGKQCTPCSELYPCGESMACVQLADTGTWCVAACETNDDCSTGFACGKIGDTPRCIPHGGDISVRCATSRRTFFGTNPEPGPGALVDESGNYNIVSRLGEVTVYCVGGYIRPNTTEFIPVAMGMRPTVVVMLDNHTPEVDLTLDIALSRTLRARVFDLPTHPAGRTAPQYRPAVDIGAEGWIPFNEMPTYTDGELRYFVGYPESLAPFGKDAAYTFYSTVLTNTSPPVLSYRLNYRLDSVDGDPLLVRDESGEALWAHPETGMTGDLSSIWGSGVDNVWAVGPNGRIVHKGPLGWGPQPHFTFVDLNSVWGSLGNDIWAVGDEGVILHFNGSTWAPAQKSTLTTWDIRSVNGQWAVGDEGILRRTGGGVWSVYAALHSDGLRAVHEVSPTLAFAVGESGKVLTWNGSSWSSEIVFESGVRLNGVWGDGDTTWVVGDFGAVARRDSAGTWEVFTPPTPRDLTAVLGDDGGGVTVAGTAGTILTWTEEDGWTQESDDASAHLDVLGLWRGPEGLLAVGGTSLPVGPWMSFNDPVNPKWYEFLDKTRLTWKVSGEPGPTPTYNSVYLSSSDGFTVWAMIVAGELSSVDLPNLMDVVEWDPIVDGQKYFNLTRGLNPAFDMAGYRYNHLSLWRRTTWSTAYGVFY